jgi:hypothetical protein
MSPRHGADELSASAPRRPPVGLDVIAMRLIAAPPVAGAAPNQPLHILQVASLAPAPRRHIPNARVLHNLALDIDASHRPRPS